MRTLLSLLVVGSLVGGPALVAGKPKHPRKKPLCPKPAKVDVSKVQKILDVFHDGKGHYFVVMHYKHRRTHKVRSPGDWLFYGDGKRFYRQRSSSAGRHGDDYYFSINDPRVLRAYRSYFKVKGGKTTFRCEERITTLQMLSSDKAAAMLNKAEFRDVYWVRRPHVLARDDDGVYYYVDRLVADDYATERHRGFRVYVGQSGQMKQLRMKNVVSDMMGEIFVTTNGKLRLAFSGPKRDSGKVTWIKGVKKPQKLTMIPQTPKTRTLIYRELGVYTGVKLRRPCDDL